MYVAFIDREMMKRRILLSAPVPSLSPENEPDLSLSLTLPLDLDWLYVYKVNVRNDQI